MKTKEELFAEAFLFLYAAAGKNLGFDVWEDPEDDRIGNEQEDDLQTT